MKTLTLIFSMITLLTFNSVGQSNETNKLLENPATRNEIFLAILNNHGLMTDFMKTMKENDHAMMMMESEMMGKDGRMEMKGEHQMKNHDKMMSMMKDNPDMMPAMMNDMMDMCEKDTAMQTQMAGMMAQHPEMMKKCMLKMQDNEKMGIDGNMKMVDSENAKEDKEHNHQH